MSDNKSKYRIRPVVLIILDGWGVAPPSQGNAITLAETPFFDSLVNQYQVFTVLASGEAVGLPRGEMGNSEVGHANIGAGRIVQPDLPRINQSIVSGDFFDKPVLLQAVFHVKKNNGTLHLLGLVSDGGVHSSLKHLFALLELCEQQGVKDVLVHAVLDGRDTPYNSARKYVDQVSGWMSDHKIGRIASVAGRFWSLDRDQRWERTEAAYRAMVDGASYKNEDTSFSSAEDVIDFYYKQGVYDENIPPTVIQNNETEAGTVQDGDGIIFFNFRPDRARQLTRAFVDEGFEYFSRSRFVKNLFFVTMTQYESDLPVHVAFPSEHIEKPLARVVSDAGLTQFHVAETEKYAHVTYFIDGGEENGFDREEQVLVPSPRVASYAERPEMSAYAITERVEQEIVRGVYDLYIINYANSDMVGHTGDLQATIRAIEVIDKCLKRVVESVLKHEGAVIITADHGNAEILLDPMRGDINKEHSLSPVPCIVIGKEWYSGESFQKKELYQLTPAGVLSDIAPTVLKILGLERPKEMTGRSLV